jgi:hypothetical protein
MTRRFMLGIETRSKSAITQGVGCSITFEEILEDKPLQSSSLFNEWRMRVTEIVLSHRDDVFDAATGEASARQMVSEIIAISKALGIVVTDNGDVPAIQVSGIDPHNAKQGKKLDIRFAASDDSPVSIEASDYKVRRPQEVCGDGNRGVSLPAKRVFAFLGKIVAL